MSHGIEDDFAEFFAEPTPVVACAPTAMQLTGDTTWDVLAWLPVDMQQIRDVDGCGKAALFVRTPSGFERVWLNDWIIRTKSGAFLRSATAPDGVQP